nr:hypothetical protein [uncultured Pseudomonas sp.]
MRHNQKLTAEDAEHIRQLHEWKQGEIRRLNEIASAEALAKKYGVHRRTIEKVLHYRTH